MPEIQFETRHLAWSFGYAGFSNKNEFVLIREDAIAGIIVSLRQGNVSRPALIAVHGGTGTIVGATLLQYLPMVLPLVALQAPEMAAPDATKRHVDSRARMNSYTKVLIIHLK